MPERLFGTQEYVSEYLLIERYYIRRGREGEWKWYREGERKKNKQRGRMNGRRIGREGGRTG